MGQEKKKLDKKYNIKSYDTVPFARSPVVSYLNRGMRRHNEQEQLIKRDMDQSLQAGIIVCHSPVREGLNFASFFATHW